MKTLSLSTVRNVGKHNTLCLWFAQTPELTLERVLFQSRLLEEPILSVRGKSPGAFAGASTFQWYLGPQALAAFLVRSKLEKPLPFLPVVEGGPGTIAACVNTTIEKTSWIHDIFGCQADGTSIVRRLISRSNYRRRGTNSVALSLNEKFLDSKDINVFLDGAPVLDPKALLKLAEEIEEIWTQKVQARARSSVVALQAAA